MVQWWLFRQLSGSFENRAKVKNFEEYIQNSILLLKIPLEVS